MSGQNTLIAGIDAGGTTFKCALATAQRDIIERRRIQTTTPADTLLQCVEFFRAAASTHGAAIGALGIGAFGPLCVDPDSPDYGTILKTPKIGWSMTPLKQRFETDLQIPVIIETDVHAALGAEASSGAAANCSSAAYITVGTGVGAGIFAGGAFLGAPQHPEFGHFFPKRHPFDTDSDGICIFHGDCLEGLASAASFEQRHGDPRMLPKDDAAWQIEAYYLAQACWNLTTTARLERIILGGGLMQAPHLIGLVRAAFLELNANYLPLTPQEIEDLIVLPDHGDDAGLIGALQLAGAEQL